MTLSRFLDGAASVIVAALVIWVAMFLFVIIVHLVKEYPHGALTLGAAVICAWAAHRVLARGASR